MTVRLAVVHPYWDFWAGSTSFDLEASRRELLSDAVGRLAAHGDVVWSGLVDAATVTGCSDELAAMAPDVVVVLQSMATPPAVTTSVLDRLGSCPVVVWTLRRGGSVAPGFDHGDITAEGATVGTPMLTSVLVRAGRPFDLVTRPLDDPQLGPELASTIRAAAVAGILRRARIGRVGGPIPGYSCVDLDPDRLAAAVGTTVVSIEPAEFLRSFRAVGADELAGALAALSHRVPPGTGLAADDVERAVRARLALDRLVVEHRLDAGAMNCHVAEIRLGTEIGIAPCFALGCATSRGVPWTCSGDVVTAVAMLAVSALGGGVLYHELEAFDQDSGTFVIANSGEHDERLADRAEGVELAVNPWYPGPPRSLCARFAIPAGPAALVGFAQLDAPASHRFVVARGEFVAGGFPATGTANAGFRFADSDAAEAWRRWCLAGVNHHSVATAGDPSADIARLATHLGVELVSV